MKILIADDHVLFREALHLLLGALWPQAEILDAGSFHEAFSLAEGNPDIRLALLDLNMPGNKGDDTVREFCSRFMDVPVVVVSGVDQRDSIERMLNNGAMGFIPKTTDPQEIRNALRLVVDGGIYLPPLLLQKVLPLEPQAISVNAGDINLTERQFQVLRQMCNGNTNKEIGQALKMAEGTVKVHVAAIFNALGVSKRVDAVVKAQRMGLLPP